MTGRCDEITALSLARSRGDDEPMRVGVAGVVVALALGVLCSCAGGPTDLNDGDCGGSIRFRGMVYVGDTRLNHAAPFGRTLGPGAVVDCDHRTVVDLVVVSAVKGADSRLAIRVGRGKWHGLYVAADLPRAQWPKAVRQH
jgi:hypothetical protein